jgi:hypothetical protein
MTMSAIPASSNLPGSGQVAAIILSVWEGQDAAVATLTSAVRKADAIAQILGGYVINLDELQHSLPDESNMMIASESLYLGAAVTKSEAEIAAAQLHQRRAQRRLTAGHPDMGGPMSQLLVRFFHWRRDHARRKPGEPRSIGGQGLADEFRSTGDHSEEVADEPFLEAGELDDKPD